MKILPIYCYNDDDYDLMTTKHHRHCSKKSAISSYNLFVSQTNLYDGQQFIQSHVRIMKLAPVDKLIWL